MANSPRRARLVVAISGLPDRRVADLDSRGLAFRHCLAVAARAGSSVRSAIKP